MNRCISTVTYFEGRPMTSRPDLREGSVACQNQVQFGTLMIEYEMKTKT